MVGWLREIGKLPLLTVLGDPSHFPFHNFTAINAAVLSLKLELKKTDAKVVVRPGPPSLVCCLPSAWWTCSITRFARRYGLGTKRPVSGTIPGPTGSVEGWGISIDTDCLISLQRSCVLWARLSATIPEPAETDEVTCGAHQASCSPWCSSYCLRIPIIHNSPSILDILGRNLASSCVVRYYGLMSNIRGGRSSWAGTTYFTLYDTANGACER